ncbi:MAG: 4Fe-4S binding protein [Firmicutes bacterium]|nr:4Fe-4S binding protein [Bacillota bacterium]
MINISKIYAVYFSPNKSTKRITEYLAREIAGILSENLSGRNNLTELTSIDFTLPPERGMHYSFQEGDLLIFGCPTYAGKLPNKILPFIKEGFSGCGACAIPIVTFGNRSFDNSLAELADSLESNNFTLLAAGAFCTQHAFTRKLGTGRPDQRDYRELSEFAEAISYKIKTPCESCGKLSIPGNSDAPYYTPLGTDGNPAVFLKAKPKTKEELCDDCGFCASHCPTGAISPDDFAQITGTCIKCHACVNLCHGGAKYFDDPAFLSHKRMLELNFSDERKPNFTTL